MPVRRARMAIVSSGVRNLFAAFAGQISPPVKSCTHAMYPCDNPAARKANQKVNPLQPCATIDSSVKSRLQTIIYSANRCSSRR